MSDEVNMKVILKTDNDGFLSQECPSCNKRFKVKYGEGSDQPISFCPYCGHNGKECWWTKEQSAYIRNVIMREKIDPGFEKMARNVNRRYSPKDFISIKMNFKPTPAIKAPEEVENGWPKILFKCCDEKIKHDECLTKLFCVICGKEIEL